MRNIKVELICMLIIILAILLQFNLFNNIPLFGVKPNLGIVFVSAIGIACESKIGKAIGIAYGILSDVVFGRAFGIYTLLYFLIGHFTGKFGSGFSKDNKSSLLMIVAITTVLFEVSYMIISSISFGQDFGIINFLITVGLECIYNILIASILFKPLKFLGEIINKGKRSYYLL